MFQPNEVLQVTLDHACVVTSEDGQVTVRYCKEQPGEETPGVFDTVTIAYPAHGVQVTRLATENFPPQVGDVWLGPDGKRYFAIERNGEVWLRGENDVAVKPEHLLALGPMALESRKATAGVQQ